MNKAVRLIHCLGAILTGIVMVTLAIVLNATHGSAGGVLLGFLSLGSGYAASVSAVGHERPTNFAIAAVLLCWAFAVCSIIAAIAAVS